MSRELSVGQHREPVLKRAAAWFPADVETVRLVSAGAFSVLLGPKIDRHTDGCSVGCRAPRRAAVPKRLQVAGGASDPGSNARLPDSRAEQCRSRCSRRRCRPEPAEKRRSRSGSINVACPLRGRGRWIDSAKANRSIARQCRRPGRARPAADASARPTAHEDAVPRHPSYGGLPARAAAAGQPQACGTFAPAHGPRSHLSEAAPESGWAGSRDVPLCPLRARDPATEPGSGDRHHLIPLRRGFVGLVAIMDGSSRHVRAWEVAATMGTAFGLAALEQALRRGKPDIFNSGQDCRHVSAQFDERARKSCSSGPRARAGLGLRQHLQRAIVTPHGQVRKG